MWLPLTCTLIQVYVTCSFFFFLFCLTHSFNYLLSSPAPSGPPTNIRVIKVTSVDVDLVWKRPDFPIFASFIYTLYWGTARNELEVKPVLWCTMWLRRCAFVWLCVLCVYIWCLCGSVWSVLKCCTCTYHGINPPLPPSQISPPSGWIGLSSSFISPWLLS